MKEVKGMQLVENMGAEKVGVQTRGGVERRNGQMRVKYEKERKAGHIVESRPGQASSLFSQQTSLYLLRYIPCHFLPPFLSPCFLNMSLHDVTPPYSCSRKHALWQPVFSNFTDNKQNHTIAHLQSAIQTSTQVPSAHLVIQTSWAHQRTVPPWCFFHPLVLMRHIARLLYCEATVFTVFLRVILALLYRPTALSNASFFIRSYMLACYFTLDTLGGQERTDGNSVTVSVCVRGWGIKQELTN